MQRYVHCFELMCLGTKKSQTGGETERVSGLSLSHPAFSSVPPAPFRRSRPLVFLPAGPRFFFQESFEVLDLMSQLRKKPKHHRFSILGLF